MTGNPATVTVVTSPDGVDVGPVAAHLGKTSGLADGLTVRTLGDPGQGGAYHHPHASPNPYDGTPLLHLLAVPSAWQDPQTNLGIAWTGPADTGLPQDLDVMQAAGLDPAHRLTVQCGPPRGGWHGRDNITPPVQYGNLAEAARDSVLRGSADSSRHVLVEAGDGQTFLQALATLGLAPWEPSIDVLDLWLVVDAAAGRPNPSFLDTVAAEVARQGGRATPAGNRLGALHLAVLNVHTFMPELAAVDYAGLLQLGGAVGEDVANALGSWLTVAERRTGARVDLISTGPGPDGCPVFIDLRPATD